MYTDSRHRQQDSAMIPPSQQSTGHLLDSSTVDDEAHGHEEVPKQLGRWLQYHIQRMPARAVMALLNRFSINTVSSCLDLLALSMCLLVNRKISVMSEELDATPASQYAIFFSVSLLCNLSTFHLRDIFYRYLEKIEVQSLDADDKSAPPHQLLIWVTNKLRCNHDIVEKLCQEISGSHAPHFRVVLDLFKTILTMTVDERSVALIQMHNILASLAVRAELAAASASRIVLQMEQSHNNTLNVLDRLNYWILAQTVFATLETDQDTGRYSLLLRIQSMYNDWALVETMFSVNYSSWLPLCDNRSLGEHNMSAMIFATYKGILHQCGVCKFLYPPQKVHQGRLTCYFALPSAKVFYQFQRAFLQKLHDTSAFFQFAKKLMSEKETILLKYDTELHLLISNKKNQHASRLDRLQQQQEQHKISKNEYLRHSQDLVNKHNQELDKIWLKHIRGLFSRIPERLKNSGGNRKVPANLSLMQLMSKYNWCWEA